MHANSCTPPVVRGEYEDDRSASELAHTARDVFVRHDPEPSITFRPSQLPDLPAACRSGIGFARNFRSHHRFTACRRVRPGFRRARMEAAMHSIIYLVGLIVVVLFILSFLGPR